MLARERRATDFTSRTSRRKTTMYWPGMSSAFRALTEKSGVGLLVGALGDEASWQAPSPSAAKVRNANGLI